MSLLEVRNVQKIYKSKYSNTQVEALKDISFNAEQGEFTAIMGESGSGKTTLLNILAALDKPTNGSVKLNGTDFSSVPSKKLYSFRRNNLGFVFQNYNLLDMFNVKDNILLPLVLNGEKPKEMEKRLQESASILHIVDILPKFPYELSGGQKQRVAAARALITKPQILLADEPTGALDSRNSQMLLELLDYLNRQGQTILMVTHSVTAASFAKRVLFIKDGHIYHQLYRGEKTRDEFFENISNTLTIMMQNTVLKPDADSDRPRTKEPDDMKDKQMNQSLMVNHSQKPDQNLMTSQSQRINRDQMGSGKDSPRHAAYESRSEKGDFHA